ncbi:MAG: putative lipid II flippase FtsW [Gammaproteobacteria bacterium]
MKIFEELKTFNFDWILLTIFLAITGLGLIALASASFAVGVNEYADAYYYLKNQMIALVIALILFPIIALTPIKNYEKSSLILLIVGIILLVLVFVPGLGQTRNGSTRWIDLGIITVQPSEVAKLFIGIYFCSYAYRHQEKLRTTFTGLLRPLGILIIAGGLLLKEPDFGSFLVLSSILLAVLYVGGARYLHMSLLFIGLLSLSYFLAFSEGYRIDRIKSFLDPWSDPFDTGFQLTQSLMAVGSGGLFGLGLGNSVQKLYYLPEAHTDFVFAVFAEEFGFIGTLLLLLLFFSLIARILFLSSKAIKQGQYFHGLLSFFLGIYLASSILLNISVTIGLVPTKGLTLPFFSYGRSSYIVSVLIIFVVFRIFHEVERHVFIQRTQKEYRQTLMGKV